MPPAAMIPAWRIAPPICCFNRQASTMNSREPASAAPTGAPSPFVKSTQAESKPAAKSRAETPLATTALKSRAPSMWVASPCLRATLTTASMPARAVPSRHPDCLSARPKGAGCAGRTATADARLPARPRHRTGPAVHRGPGC